MPMHSNKGQIGKAPDLLLFKHSIIMNNSGSNNSSKWAQGPIK